MSIMSFHSVKLNVLQMWLLFNCGSSNKLESRFFLIILVIWLFLPLWIQISLYLLAFPRWHFWVKSAIREKARKQAKQYWITYKGKQIFVRCIKVYEGEGVPRIFQEALTLLFYITLQVNEDLHFQVKLWLIY